MTAVTDRTSAAITQLVEALGELAAAQVAAEIERQLGNQQIVTPPQAPASTRASTGKWMTVAEAATHCGRHPETLYLALGEYVHSNHRTGLRGSQSGPRGRWRIRQGDLELWMEGAAPKRRGPV